MTRRRFAASGAKRSEARKQRKRPEGFWSSGLGSAAGPQPGALLAPRVAPRGGRAASGCDALLPRRRSFWSWREARLRRSRGAIT